MNSINKYNTFDHRQYYKTGYTTNFDSNSSITSNIAANIERGKQHSLSSFDSKKYLKNIAMLNNNSSSSSIKLANTNINESSLKKDSLSVYTGRNYIKKYLDNYESATTNHLNLNESDIEQNLELKANESSSSMDQSRSSSFKVKYDKMNISTIFQAINSNIGNSSLANCNVNNSGEINNNNMTTMTTVTVTTPATISPSINTTKIINEKMLKSNTLANFSDTSKYDMPHPRETFDNNLNARHTDPNNKSTYLTESSTIYPTPYKSKKYQNQAKNEKSTETHPTQSQNVIMRFEKLEEYFNKMAQKSSEAIAKEFEAQIAAASTANSGVVDQVAEFIEELKDFIDDRLVDTTCQLELSNQRIGDLHMSLNYLIGEITYLKFQNQELKNEMHSFLINLKNEQQKFISSNFNLESKNKFCNKCSSSSSKSKNKHKNKSSESSSSADYSSTTINTNSTTNPSISSSTNIKKDNKSKNHSKQNNHRTSSSKNKNKKSETTASTGTNIDEMNSGEIGNLGSAILCSVIDDDLDDSSVKATYNANMTEVLDRYFKNKYSLDKKNLESLTIDSSFDSQFKLEWPFTKINAIKDMASNLKVEAELHFVRSLIDDMNDNSVANKKISTVSTELSDELSTSSSKGGDFKSVNKGIDELVEDTLEVDENGSRKSEYSTSDNKRTKTANRSDSSKSIDNSGSNLTME